MAEKEDTGMMLQATKPFANFILQVIGAKTSGNLTQGSRSGCLCPKDQADSQRKPRTISS